MHRKVEGAQHEELAIMLPNAAPGERAVMIMHGHATANQAVQRSFCLEYLAFTAELSFPVPPRLCGAVRDTDLTGPGEDGPHEAHHINGAYHKECDPDERGWACVEDARYCSSNGLQPDEEGQESH